MIKQLFVIFKLDSAESMHDVEQKCQAFEAQFLDKSDFDSLSCLAPEDGFYYVLYNLANPLTQEQVKLIKNLLLEGKLPCDVLMSPDFPCFSEKNTQPGALVMDMDMTTVQIEGIDEIARRLGVFDEVAAITHEAMHGKLEFSQSLQRRVALLKGGDAAKIIQDVRESMPETSGLQQLMECCDDIRSIDNMGAFYTCIASGGFHNLISKIDDKYKLSKIRANRLAVDSEGKFTGEVDGPIIDGQAKADLVKELKAAGIPKERIIVLGDGANDLLMMHEGGLGIAYHAKPKVQEQQLNALNVGDLSAVAVLLKLRASLEEELDS